MAAQTRGLLFAIAFVKDVPVQPVSPVLSVVVPCYNESGNVLPLVEAIRAVLDPLNLPYEVLFADDASTDDSWAKLRGLGARDARIRGLRFERNFGQSAALWAGIQAARGRFIATLDADLQNDPRDLPAFLEAIKKYDCVCGSRVANRQKGDSWLRLASSRIANGVRNRLTHETVTDSGCCYRVFRRECASNLKFFKGMHRFLPTLFKIEGYTVVEIPVSHHPRFAGQSHYGVWNRLFASFYDLLAVRWMQKRMFRFEVGERVNFPPEAPGGDGKS
jgi:dolichol-phosphate mannosyltransferase